MTEKPRAHQLGDRSMNTTDNAPALPTFLPSLLCAAMQEWVESTPGDEAAAAFEHVESKYIAALKSYAHAAVLADRASRDAVAVPEEIRQVAARLHTQDNRITDNPLFAVQQKRRFGGVDSEYADASVWISDGCEVDAEEAARLDALLESGETVPADWPAHRLHRPMGVRHRLLHRARLQGLHRSERPQPP